MRKSKAIRLLNQQIEKIDDPLINRQEWISLSSALLLRVFPLSAEIKIKQLQELDAHSDFYNDMSSGKRIENKKKKAESYINNYIEEIELFGIESHNKIEMFFGSYRFWGILLTICLLSFIGGSSISSGEELNAQQTARQQVYSLNQELLLKNTEIDSLKKLISNLKENL